MFLETTHPSGAEEWACPTCGRRMLLNWQPQFEKIILQTGDQYARHRGSAGGLEVGPVVVGDGPSHDENLEVWEKGLDDLDLDSLLA
jgi:hypothetical protein